MRFFSKKIESFSKKVKKSACQALEKKFFWDYF